MAEKAVGMGSDWREVRLSCCADPIRTSPTEFKIPRRRKRRLKSEFALFQPLSQLLKLVYLMSNASELFLSRIPKNHIQVQKEKENLAVACLCPS